MLGDTCGCTVRRHQTAPTRTGEDRGPLRTSYLPHLVLRRTSATRDFSAVRADPPIPRREDTDRRLTLNALAEDPLLAEPEDLQLIAELDHRVDRVGEEARWFMHSQRDPDQITSGIFEFTSMDRSHEVSLGYLKKSMNKG
ncbi:MAG: hypothetical protein ACXV8R_02295 [Acidimicrobiia bacterium]